MDVKNKRKDKWIPAGLATKNQMFFLSLLFGFSGMAMLYLANIFLFLVGIYYVFLYFGYSHPRIPIGRDLTTYLLLSSIYLPIFYILSRIVFKTGFTGLDMAYTLFAFFQSAYLISHKDVNDTQDDTNIFLEKYGRAFIACAIFGILAAAFLLSLSLTQSSLIVLWLLNVAVLKFSFLKKLHEKSVERRFRDWVVLFEFLTPYFYAVVISFRSGAL